MAESQATLDRGYGKPHQAQSIDVNITEGAVRYVEVPRKAANADEWLQQQVPALASADAESDKLN
jgi:hypothetical protein